jgi:hypothetical protein
MSLDGFIAGSKGGCDWIVHDPTIDIGALFGSSTLSLWAVGSSVSRN